MSNNIIIGREKYPPFLVLYNGKYCNSLKSILIVNLLKDLVFIKLMHIFVCYLKIIYLRK